MNERTALSLLALVLTTVAAAQERYWVASLGGVTQIDTGGFAFQTVPPTSARDIAVAPDGKVWIPGSTITVLNPDGTPFTTITPSAGITPYAIAFDRAGHAWVTSTGSAVEEFDAAGVSQGVVPLPTGAARDICVDADGNKWIAHRIGPPGSLSRIDAATGAVTSHPLPATSLILPISVQADARGLFTSSHIWTVGDNRGAGEVVEFDATGTVLNTYVVSSTARLQWMSADCDSSGLTQNIWVGDWSNGDLHQVDAATGAVTTFPQGDGVGGVTFDGFGNLLITTRSADAVRRIDPATAVLEVESLVGAANEVSTRWEFATVVDPLGDLDLDGVLNVFEVMGGSSPFDGCSVANASLSIEGPTSIGSTLTVAVQADPGVLTIVAFAINTVSPGFVVPGIGCTVQIDPATLLGTFIAIGPAGLPLTIPNSPAFVGFRIAAQGLNAGTPTFTNAAPMLFW